ncbi:MAG TPA: DUF1761 domain-containing protein [Steroidobacteraceae bacterium]|nr:DUF1761 domain-containing protein [Steroidobacteraceae bacterium]HRX89586.1 DUF1761 domain-containing protein [Steroidobacteraceae bacterium]
MDASQAMTTINWLAVLAAAASGFVIGGLWYGPLFGKAWMTAAGMTEEKVRAGNPAITYGLTFVLSLIAAFSLAMFIGGGDLQFGLFAGFMTGLTFVAVALGITYLFEKRPLNLWLINSGYQVVFFTVMGAILGGWK